MHKITRASDWANSDVAVWTLEDGYLFPKLETPEPGQCVLYVDYERNPEDHMIQAAVELEIEKLGYPVGPRWIGSSPKDPGVQVVSFVGLFPGEELIKHIKILEPIVRMGVLRWIGGPVD